MRCKVVLFITYITLYNEGVLASSPNTIKEIDKNIIPLYSWSKFLNNSDSTRSLIHRYNKEYNNQNLKIENNLIDLYSDFIKYRKNYYLNNQEALNSNHKTLNICSLDANNQIQYLLENHPPENGKIVVDIGSGLGQCSKQLALLGYEVFSIDKESKMIEFQKHNFCEPIAPETFVYFYWKRYKPYLLNKDNYNNYCQKIRDTKVHFITDNFISDNTLKKLERNKKVWDIVIGLMSLQFFDDRERKIALKIIDDHQSHNSILILSTQPSHMYKDKTLFGGVYNFSLEEMLDSSINKKYKVLIAEEASYLMISHWLYLMTFIKKLN